ncbi:protein FAM117A-like [Megalops cyprinoides]|uniref:protein FAM117A-like n=1 Tax=Megalops cyprinoides TaxID=118141 RepID=UPI0018644788|nr:protein FAM117A-like [Megalops cyprinoides]
MSCRSAVVRGGTSGVQPLKATVPFQLHNKAQTRLRDAKTAEKTKSRPPKPSIRRTLSLDNMVGPYLQGQWPKEPDQGISCVNDKATQTPSTWSEESRGRRGGVGHKRSASWGSAEHLKEIAKLKHHLQKRSKHTVQGGYERDHHQNPLPGGYVPGSTQTMPLTPLCRLTPRLRHSVEGLSLELERVFVQETPEEQHKILDIPDGHRAPVPPQRCSSDSQSDPSPAPLDPTLLSPSPSPCSMGETDFGTLCPSPSPPLGSAEPSPLLLSSSPRPNKTYTFQREPPEGCERVRVCEEALSPCKGQPILHPSCPDPNKVNFTPHGGSAFCPVSLLKPLLPSMDILFRSLSVSPVTGRSAPGGAPCQAAASGVGGYLGPLPDSATTAM